MRRYQRSRLDERHRRRRPDVRRTRIVYERGDDKLNGYEGDDSLYGERGNDTSNGGAGEDYFSDYYGANTLNGGAGNDVFNADYGDVTGEISIARGGGGNDRVWSFDRTKDAINCGPGTDVVYSYDSGLDTLRGCELDGNGMPLP